MRNALIILLLLCCSACFGQGLAFGGGQLSIFGYYYLPTQLNYVGNPTTAFVMPVEPTSEPLKCVGDVTSFFTLPVSGVSIAATSAKFGSVGVAYDGNLSQDRNMTNSSVGSFFSLQNLQVEFWFRIDQIGSFAGTLAGPYDFFGVDMRDGGSNRLAYEIWAYNLVSSDVSSCAIKLVSRYSYLGNNGGGESSGQIIDVGDWHHACFMRFTSGLNSYTVFFLDGVNIGFVANDDDSTGTISFISRVFAGSFATAGTQPKISYSFDDLLVTGDYNRATAGFTPPTQSPVIFDSGAISLGGN